MLSTPREKKKRKNDSYDIPFMIGRKKKKISVNRMFKIKDYLCIIILN